MFTDCSLKCLLAAGLFSSMLYSTLNQTKNVLVTKFQETLTEEQNAVYKQVVKERMTIYVNGLLLGLLLGFIYLNFVNKSSVKSACMFTVVVLGTNYLYYMLYPKTQYMLPLLETEEQRVAWVVVYKEMRHRCFIGFILGMVAYLLIGLYA